MSVQGTAIYAFGIIESCATQFTAQYQFYIDNSFAGEYLYNESMCSEIRLYDQLFFSKDNIEPGTHTFTLQNGISTAGETTANSTALLDYIIYTRYRLCFVDVNYSLSVRTYIQIA